MEEQTVNWVAAIFVLLGGALAAGLVYFFAGNLMESMLNEKNKDIGGIVVAKSPPYFASLVFLFAVDQFIKITVKSHGIIGVFNMVLFITAIIIILKMIKSIRTGVAEARYGIKKDKTRLK